MGRLQTLCHLVDQELESIDIAKKTSAITHLYGVSLSATIIARHRHINSELAAMAGMLHDLAAYKNGSYKDHDILSAKLAKEILEKSKLTNEEETQMITQAIFNHDHKERVDSPFDEVLKDADVMHHVFRDLDQDVKEKEKQRYLNLCEEFQL